MSEVLNGLMKLDKKMAEPVIKMLSRAFWKYPLLTHFFPDESRRQAVAESVLAMPVYTCLHYGEVYVTSPGLEGAAAWTPSKNYPVSLWGLIRTVPVKYIMGMSGAARMQSVDRLLNDIHRRLVPYPHYYLEILGVEPEHQKKGFSSKLMKPMLQRLDRQKMDCFLETQDPQDVAIYQHFGFEIMEKSEIPDTPLVSWAMLRKSNRK
ncbi:MAG TPA: GNAT family N-acetyltransferase [Dehalococcoidales bacterium]|nr:GNAT family N-acetyltransferase [Dehalococcoidales bacterium]